MDWQKLFERFEPVGSRVTCDPAPLDTDEDWLALMLTDRSASLAEMGFECAGPEEFYTESGEGEFRSWRRGVTNLIVTPDETFYQRFLLASGLAKRFNLLRKADRIALFQAVLYGAKAQEQTPSLASEEILF